jgi:hypothetical protein
LDDRFVARFDDCLGPPAEVRRSDVKCGIGTVKGRSACALKVSHGLPGVISASRFREGTMSPGSICLAAIIYVREAKPLQSALQGMAWLKRSPQIG